MDFEQFFFGEKRRCIVGGVELKREPVALVSGVTGQDGSYLSELLLKKGYMVYGLDRRKADASRSNIKHLLGNEHFKVLDGDLLEESRLNSIIKMIRPDELYHLAAQSFVKASWDVPLYTCNVNALSAYNINYKHEYQILTHKRFDFWINGIVLEVKKSRPSKINLLNQLDRYTKVPAVRAIIVVLEKNITISKQLNGKPIIVKSLNENWGVAL